VEGRDDFNYSVAGDCTERGYLLLDAVVPGGDDMTVVWICFEQRIIAFVEPERILSPPNEGMRARSVLGSMASVTTVR
jgi:hypothetical protein